ncbi:envelope glycoprotein [Mus dunni endogenous virus]|uniref:Envelope glycoprotein n=1 Tax=Mus dunni endogenous virus TaxID=75986 RepID=O89816_MULV|nr:envelope glycoprotein [Mus dunni endogenous virus]
MKKPTKTTGLWKPLITLLSFACVAGAPSITLDLGNHNPHAPVQQSWEVLNEKGDVVWVATAVHPPWTWWPDLTPDICKLAAGSPNWDLPDHTDLNNPPSEQKCVPNGVGSTTGCSGQFYRANLRAAQFYVCPGQGQKGKLQQECRGASDYFCGKWTCETTGEAYWKPSADWDLITVKRGSGYDKPNQGERNPYKYLDSGCALKNYSPPGPCKGKYCNPLLIKFTEKGKQARLSWLKGNRWGWRVYIPIRDPGFIFTIRLTVRDLAVTSIGPNKVLTEQAPPVAPAPPRVPAVPAPPTSRPYTVGPSLETTLASPPLLDTENRLVSLVQGAFLVLNRTNPNMTQSCWLCYASNPPYYEGIAQTRTYNITSDHSQCLWGENRKLTLTAVSGNGLCLGQVPQDKWHLCNQTQNIRPNKGGQYLVPPIDTVWACNTGLTPCISMSVFNSSKDFCILVQLIPRLLYHDDSSFLDKFEHRVRWKREPITLTLAVLLGLGVAAAGVGTGTAALIQTPRYFEELRTAMDTDLRAIEHSITKLEESLTSLSEVVLQNRRGLDLLFLKEGGLCAALKEECCFYVDHSGVIKDSMAKLRERLDIRQRERESKQGWFESWFNKSPWLTTLLSTIAGPLIILLLLLTFGPCILNKLVAFIRERINAVQVMVLKQQYQVFQEAENSL